MSRVINSQINEIRRQVGCSLGQVNLTVPGNNFNSDINLPITIAESIFRPGKSKYPNALENDADDLKCGDLSKTDLLEIHPSLWWADLDNLSLDELSEILFKLFSLYAEFFFSYGELVENTKAMIKNFKDNKGKIYSNSLLTDAIKKHDSTRKFVNIIRQRLNFDLNTLRGNIRYMDKNIANKMMKFDWSYRPKFEKGIPKKSTNTKLVDLLNDFIFKSDLFGGLAIAVHDIQAFDLEIIEYNYSNDYYDGKFKLTLWDHFGLDSKDIEDFAYIPGFCAWFILQRYKKLAYKPFITKIPCIFNFSGYINTSLYKL